MKKLIRRLRAPLMIVTIIALAGFLSAAKVASAVTTAAPTATTLAASNVTSTTATLNGSVNPGGLATTTWFQWNPPDGNSDTVLAIGSGTTAVALKANITGLMPLTAYSFQVYARNSKGQKNGMTLSFTTPAAVDPTPTPTPTVTPTPTATGVTQIPVLCFHGIGTPSSVVDSVDYYNTTLANFKAEMAWLASNGYQTITPQQYTAWLAGKAVTLPAKPVLITFDDAFPNDTQATPVLQQYGFHAVMFVVTGYANGDYASFGTAYAPWSTIETMASEGWIIQFHAGECGHAFMPYAPASCLAGLDQSLMTADDYEYYIWDFGQTDAQYEARVTAETTAGLAEIQQKLGYPAGWQSTVFAAPFGAWGNGDNPWLISYWDSIFSVVFVQYIAPGDQVTAHADHVRYRLELGYGAQTASYLAANISNSAFTVAGAGSGVKTGSAQNAINAAS
jgi:peptidoglycan/xylan/chitin deacetylase (PgdA/CDA1 family)